MSGRRRAPGRRRQRDVCAEAGGIDDGVRNGRLTAGHASDLLSWPGLVVTGEARLEHALPMRDGLCHPRTTGTTT